ncbi:hypothetical protein Tco_1269931, partial [Tanacetum coccineum]
MKSVGVFILYFMSKQESERILIVSTDRWIRLQNFPSAALRIKHAGQAVIGKGRLLCGWILGVDGYSVTSYRMVVSINTPYSSKLVGFNNDEEPIIEVDDTSYQIDTTLQVYNPTQGEFQNVGVDADPGSFFVGPMKESLCFLRLAHGLSLDVVNPIQTALAY